MAVLDQYTLLSRVVRIATSASLSYPARLKSLANTVTKSLRIASTAIYTLDDEQRGLFLVAASAGFAKPESGHVPLGEGVAGRCADKRIIVRGGRDALHPAEVFPEGGEHVLALPIIDSGRFYGVMTLGMRDGKGLPSETMTVMQDILIAVAGIIQGLKLAAGSARRVRNLTILSDLGQMLNRSIPPRALIPLILQTCHVYTDACCTLLRLTEYAGMPTGLHKKFRPRLRTALQDLIDIEKECSARVQASGIPLLACDLIADVDLPPSYICVPLRFENMAMGTITFFGKQEITGPRCNFDEEDRELFESMAMLISNALAGAANYQQMLKLSVENDKKLKELHFLYRISNTMLSTIRLNKLIHLILAALTAGPNPFFDRAMLFLINRRSGIMQGMLGATRETSAGLLNPTADMGDLLSSRWDISEEEMERQQDSEFSRQVRASRLELNRSSNVSSRAALEKRLIFIPDVTSEKRVDRDFIRRFGITSFASAPLMSKDQVVGVMVIDNAISNRPISQDDLRFLQLFTNQAGMAIENSILYNRIEDTNRSLREAQERLIQGERLAAIGEMAASIAHELKGPLVSIGGFARRLERKLPEKSTEWEYADIVVREVLRLEKMLTEILSFTKKTTICYSFCSIADIIDEALAVITLAFEENRINVIKQYPRKPITLLGDSQQLGQVFLNLFFNAQEAMRDGGELTITVTSGRLAGKRAVIVKVADTGGGIPLEALANIFSPFYTTKETGTGLGLPISNRIIINHGGKIQVDNKPGQGVTFSVYLPLHV
jgi:two-component system, NtrC family, sensor histidine kinase HydH